LGYFCTMFKKVALYGLAFGSASAAMVLIQFINGLYRERTLLSAIPVIANIAIPGFGVFLFIRSLSVMKTAKPINMGKALFGALLVCILVAVCNIAAYQHVMFNRTDVIQDLRKLNYTMMEKKFNSDTTLVPEKKAEELALAKENFEENISTGSFGRTQFMMCLSTGMVVALLTFLRNSRRQ
jgi:hypothetical protein